MDLGSIVKEEIINCIKRHNEDNGKIIEFFNHINEANKVFYSLPDNIKNELKTAILLALKANGFSFPING